jgi:hypothetical protein
MTVHYVETTKGHITEAKTKDVHLCLAARARSRRLATARQRRDEVVHVCQKCGSKDVMCCVMKKGGKVTPGMEEN